MKTTRIAFAFLLTMLLSGLSFGSMAQTNIKSIDGVTLLPTNSALKNLQLVPSFSVFAGLLSKVALPTNNITILAPDNKVFAKLKPGLADSLAIPEKADSLGMLIKAHVIAGKLTMADIARQIKAGNGKATFTTLSGEKLTAVIDSNRNIMLTDALGKRAIIARFDISASNGIIHTVTNALGPAAIPVF